MRDLVPLPDLKVSIGAEDAQRMSEDELREFVVFIGEIADSQRDLLEQARVASRKEPV